jgi:hypothetical protein
MIIVTLNIFLNNLKRSVLFRCILFFSTALLAPNALTIDLIPCPDCKRSVSPRASFCPNCGCPEKAIAEQARGTLNRDSRKPDKLLRVESDGKRTEIAFPVEMADGLFAIASLNTILAADTVTLSFLTTNSPVAYGLPEVAIDVPLVRFPISETNLQFWCVASQSSEVAGFFDFSQTSGSSFSIEPTGRTLAEVSKGTNIVSVYVDLFGKKVLQRVWDGIVWQKITPKDFREQSRIFEKIVRGEKVQVPNKWCHPIFEALLKRKQAGEKQ